MPGGFAYHNQGSFAPTLSGPKSTGGATFSGNFGNPVLNTGSFSTGSGGQSAYEAQPLELPGLPTLQPGQQANIQESGSYFDNPALVRELSGSLGGLGMEMANLYGDFLSNPTGSPLFQNILSGMLGELAPQEAMSRMNLNDQFRASGNQASSTYTDAATALETGFMRNRGALMSQVLASIFPQMTQALMAPIAQAPDLIRANTLQQSRGTSGSVQADTGPAAPPAGGISAVAGGGITGTPSGILGFPSMGSPVGRY